ncbi:MarR family winged helix-turn-helix transcriptional regulator [Nocardiopsis sediminis]|uniref:MarR family winged helix-turn-helix transcriptional regulator n=1 Tax=Nocardiopsis sediminis TaxID=1778267 RepID=A0ABV8FS87_9ACTN
MTETAHVQEQEIASAEPCDGPPAPRQGLTLAEALVRVTHLVNQEFAEASRGQGLTPQQAQLLCQLTPGPVGMTSLSRTLNLEKSSLTGLVDRVVRRGLVERTRDSQDRRACRITLTDTGARLGNATHADVVARIDRLAAGLSAAERDLLAAFIGRMVPGDEAGAGTAPEASAAAAG